MSPARHAPPLLVAFLMAVLAACAPAASAPTVEKNASEVTAQVQAAFSDEGVAWVAGQQACVARVPQLRPHCSPWPVPPAAVAWHDGQAWVALPALGQVVTLDGAAQTLTAGRAVAMSATRIYREDGSALTYTGEAAAGTLGRPTAVLTGGDGRDYALVAGRLVAVDGTQNETATGSFLMPTPSGVQATPFPTLSSGLQLRSGQVFPTGATKPLALPPITAIGRIGESSYALVRIGDGWEVRRIR